MSRPSTHLSQIAASLQDASQRNLGRMARSITWQEWWIPPNRRLGSIGCSLTTNDPYKVTESILEVDVSPKRISISYIQNGYQWNLTEHPHKPLCCVVWVTFSLHTYNEWSGVRDLQLWPSPDPYASWGIRSISAYWTVYLSQQPKPLLHSEQALVLKQSLTHRKRGYWWLQCPNVQGNPYLSLLQIPVLLMLLSIVKAKGSWLHTMFKSLRLTWRIWQISAKYWSNSPLDSMLLSLWW